MKLFYFFLNLFGVLFFFLFFTSSVEAQVTCSGGTYTCRWFQSFTNLNPPGCTPGFDCTSYTTNYSYSSPLACTVDGPTGPQCADMQNTCGTFFGGELYSESCQYSNSGCTSDNQCPGCLGCNLSTGACTVQVNAYCNSSCANGGFCNSNGSCSCIANTPTPLPACPENQSGANTIQCQGSCVQDWDPLYGYSCSGGGQCCQKQTPSACPGLPPGGRNTCRSGSCNSGESIYGSATNNACGAGQVCCFSPTTDCPGLPPGGKNTCRSGSCNSGESVYGNPDNNACGLGNVCCYSPTTACPGLPPGGVNTCRPGSCNSGETVYGDPANNACGSGNVCCFSGTSVCPNNPPEGGTNTCIAGSTCPSGSSIYGSATNNACGAGQVCCNTVTVTNTPTPIPTVAGCKNLNQSCGGSNGTCCAPNACSGGLCRTPTPTPSTTSTPTPVGSDIIIVHVVIDANLNGTPWGDAEYVGTPITYSISGNIETQNSRNGGVTFVYQGKNLSYVLPPGYTAFGPTTATPGPNTETYFLIRPEPTDTPTPTLTVAPTLDPDQLRGNIFLDTSKDGVKQAGESNFTTPGVRLWFAAADSTTRNYCGSPSSDATGLYIFTNQFDSNCRTRLVNINSMEAYFPASITNYMFTPSKTSTQTKSVVFGASPSYTANPTTLNYGIWPVVTILGRNLNAAGAQSPPGGSGVTVVGPSEGGSTAQSKATTPWDFTDIWAGTYTITANYVTGYNISYQCFGGNCASTGGADVGLTPGTWYAGRTLTKTLPNGGNYLDLRFQYVAAPTPPVPCNLDGAGDVDGDGYVTNEDAQLVVDHVLGRIVLTAAQIKRGDVNVSGTLTVADSGQISQYANGSTTTFIACTTNTFTPSPSPTVSCSGTQTVNGTIWVDTAGNNCTSGTTPYANIPVSFNRTAKSPVTVTVNTNASGAYTFTDNPRTCTGTRTITIQPAATYSVVGLQLNGVWQSPAYTSFTSPALSNVNNTLNWCVSNNTPWIQTSSGDVRRPSIVNKVPAGYKASSDATNPSVFFSSDDLLSGAFGAGGASVKNWQVPDEYSYNNDFQNGLGTMSYSFFESQRKKKGIVVSGSMGTPNSLASKNSGIYTRTGDLSLSASSIPNTVSNRHIIMLVSGNVTITGDITVAPNLGNLFILAAKGNITILPSVTTLDGYFTAEGSITSQHNTAFTCPTADVPLTVNGALIANSLRPFDVVGPSGGRVINERTLCAGNATNPSLVVNSRLEFLTQLTDFYKTTYKTYREINP